MSKKNKKKDLKNLNSCNDEEIVETETTETETTETEKRNCK